MTNNNVSPLIIISLSGSTPSHPGKLKTVFQNDPQTNATSEQPGLPKGKAAVKTRAHKSDTDYGYCNSYELRVEASCVSKHRDDCYNHLSSYYSYSKYYQAIVYEDFCAKGYVARPFFSSSRHLPHCFCCKEGYEGQHVNTKGDIKGVQAACGCTTYSYEYGRSGDTGCCGRGCN